MSAQHCRSVSRSGCDRRGLATDIASRRVSEKRSIVDVCHAQMSFGADAIGRRRLRHTGRQNDQYQGRRLGHGPHISSFTFSIASR